MDFIKRVGNCFKVFGEFGWGDKVIDFVVSRNDFLNVGLDWGGVWDVGVVGCDGGDLVWRGVVLFESFEDEGGLFGGFFFVEVDDGEWGVVYDYFFCFLC